MKGILTETRDDGMYFRFHPTEAKSVIISLQRAPITNDYKMEKRMDKRSETKKGEDQEFATHLCDTVDYYLCTKYGARAGRMTMSNSIIPAMGFLG